MHETALIVAEAVVEIVQALHPAVNKVTAFPTDGVGVMAPVQSRHYMLFGL